MNFSEMTNAELSARCWCKYNLFEYISFHQSDDGEYLNITLKYGDLKEKTHSVCFSIDTWANLGKIINECFYSLVRPIFTPDGEFASTEWEARSKAEGSIERAAAIIYLTTKPL